MISTTHFGTKDFAEVLVYLPKRLFDICVSIVVLIILAIPAVVVALVIRLKSPGPAICWSQRVGLDNRLCRMPKFLTRWIDTPEVASHLLTDPDSSLTPLGKHLRRLSIDELRQFWSILVGDMSVVGPRPALFDQYDLISMRTAAGIEKLTPGLTGWAQINGRDELSIPDKASLDAEYLRNKSFLFDLMIVFKTFAVVFRSDGLSH